MTGLWLGKEIDDLTKEELIICLKSATEKQQRMNDARIFILEGIVRDLKKENGKLWQALGVKTP